MFVMATAAPPLRGAAWLVAPALAALGLAAVAAYPPALYLWNGLAFERLIWTLLAVAIACPLLIAVYGAAVAVLYARKWAGDETVLIVQWWFVLTLTQAALLGTQGRWPPQRRSCRSRRWSSCCSPSVCGGGEPSTRPRHVCCCCARSATGSAALGCCET
jgi:hypothetical protein